MKALYEWLGLGLVFVLFLGGCSQGGPETKSTAPSLPGHTLLGSYQAHVTLDPPTVSIEQVKPSDLSPQGLAGTDLIATAFPFQIRGSLSFDGITIATISVTMTNTSSAATLNSVDVRIRSITDLNITILGDTPVEDVPGGITPGGYFLLGTVNPNNGTANDTWVFQNVTSDYRFGFDVYGSSWSPTSTTGAPSARNGHSTVWTGIEMIIWGGNTSSGITNTGGRYNPSTDSWQATSTTGAPSARFWHTVVWTGTEMIVWGGLCGSYLNTGGRYNPFTDSWMATSITGAPDGRESHIAVWTGAEMIVWGGYDGTNRLNTGGKYNTTLDSWSPTSLSGAPLGRGVHTAVWTGTEMIIWGGWDSTYTNSGSEYEPSIDMWSVLPSTGAPSGRAWHTAVWTGTEMIAWGGGNGFSDLNTGGRYRP